MTLPDSRSRFEKFRDMPVAVIEFDDIVEVMSSCIYNGGSRTCDTIAIMQVPSDYMNDEPVTDITEMIGSLGLPKETVCFMTAAEVEHVFTHASEEYGGNITMAYTTAGLANQVIAGDEITDWEKRSKIADKRHQALIKHAGTINIIGIASEPLTDNAKINAVITMTEAKTAAMHDLGFRETGTTSDAVAIVCPKDGPRQDYAGTGFGLGISLARSVRSSVRCSLIKRNDFPYRMSEEKKSELRRRYI